MEIQQRKTATQLKCSGIQQKSRYLTAIEWRFNKQKICYPTQMKYLNTKLPSRGSNPKNGTHKKHYKDLLQTCSIVCQPYFESIPRQLPRISSRHHNISRKSCIYDLCHHILVALSLSLGQGTTKYSYGEYPFKMFNRHDYNSGNSLDLLFKAR